jgi:outer membrane protein
MTHFFNSRIFLAAAISVLSITSACNNKATSTSASTNNAASATGKIAYVNIDSLQTKYTAYKTASDALAAEQSKLEAELQQSIQKFQSEAAAFQQKQQTGGFSSESEAKSMQQRLGQMQQSIESRRQNAGDQLQKKQMAFSDQYQKYIDDYVAIYNKDNKYDFILYYSKAGQILYANKALDITEDFVKGLNEYKPATTNASK